MRLRRQVLIAVAVMAMVGGLEADGAGPPAVWTAIGPYGGAVVQDVAVDPADPSVLYAATRTGVWKSTDGAQHWSWASQGLHNMWVTTIAVDPSRPARVFAGTLRRLYRSDDGGSTWAAVDMSPLGYQEYDVMAMAIAPSRPDTIFVGDPNGLFQTTDGGQDWRRIHEGQGAAVAVDPQNANVVYFSTPTQLLKTTDGGVHWSVLPIDDPFLSSLVVDPSRPATLYAAEGQVRKSTDGGATWTLLATPAGHELFDLALSPTHPDTVYAGGRTGDAEYLARSKDGGGSWADLGAVPGGNGWSANVAVDPRSPDVVYAGTFYHGVYKSTDGGRSFGEANDGMGAEPAWAIAFDPHDARTIYASIGSSGLYRSTDDGVNWTKVDAGLQAAGRELSVFALSTDGDGKVFAARNFDRTTGSPAVMASADGGAHWTSVSDSLPTGVFAKAVYADPLTTGTVFAALNVQGLIVDDDTGGLYKTVDGGDSWTMVAPTTKPIQALAFDATTHTIALASGTLGPAGDVQLYESHDWGATWQPLTYPGFRTASLAFGATTGIVYAGANFAAVAKSTDGGATWAQHLLDPLTYNGPGQVNALAVDPTDPALLYAATETEGIWSSRDGGVTWQALMAGVEDLRAMTLAFPPLPGGSRAFQALRPLVPVYGGSGGAGVERINPAPHAISAPAVAGRPRVGRTLVCRTGSWSHAAGFRYSWFRGKLPLVRHKTQRYRVTRRDRRAYLRCRVAAIGPGGTTRATSRPVRVRR